MRLFGESQFFTIGMEKDINRLYMSLKKMTYADIRNAVGKHMNGITVIPIGNGLNVHEPITCVALSAKHLSHEDKVSKH